MSPDGGLEELPECFLALANSSLHLANSFSNFSTLAANSAQPGHSGCCEEPSMMGLNLTHETEIGQGRIFGVNGYRQSMSAGPRRTCGKPGGFLPVTLAAPSSATVMAVDLPGGIRIRFEIPAC